MAHINYYLDLCVDTYIVNNNAVLLRLHEKYKHWGAPGGHIELGEDANEAAIRESWEEAGLKINLVGPIGWKKEDVELNKDLVPPFFVNRHRINDTHEHSSFVFIATSESRDIKPQNEEDIGLEFKWATQEELDELQRTGVIHDNVYRYASTALKVCNK